MFEVHLRNIYNDKIQQIFMCKIDTLSIIILQTSPPKNLGKLLQKMAKAKQTAQKLSIKRDLCINHLIEEEEIQYNAYFSKSRMSTQDVFVCKISI